MNIIIECTENRPLSGFLYFYPMMKSFVLSLTILCLFVSAKAQSYREQLEAHRDKYRSDFLTDEHSPLTKKDLKYLRFYAADSTYAVRAEVERVVDTLGFDMQTHNGILKRYVVFAKARFTLHGKAHQLLIYQSVKLRQKEGFEDYLFIPFTDETNYAFTFGGGRYLDARTGDIREGKLLLDFNKAYNPYCAFKEGYSCPIPPRENNLPVAITAGEKLFAKSVKDK